jgi:hypothetical protein
MSPPNHENTNPLSPSASLLVKLGSIVRHSEELLSPDGHDFDRASIGSLLGDPEVVEWMAAADGMALLPVRRKTSPREPSS